LSSPKDRLIEKDSPLKNRKVGPTGNRLSVSEIIRMSSVKRIHREVDYDCGYAPLYRLTSEVNAIPCTLLSLLSPSNSKPARQA
jgi:hypothetical protein